MGCVREVEQVAVRSLLAEFARLQAILGEDLIRSLSALRSELEASSEAMLADVLYILNLRSGDLELLQKYHQSVSLKVNLPLIELEAARLDLNRFLQERLRKLGSRPQVQEKLGGDHSAAVRLQLSGHRDHPRNSRCGATRCMHSDYALIGCRTAYGGSPTRHPRRFVCKARHTSSRRG